MISRIVGKKLESNEIMNYLYVIYLQIIVFTHRYMSNDFISKGRKRFAFPDFFWNRVPKLCLFSHSYTKNRFVGDLGQRIN